MSQRKIWNKVAHLWAEYKEKRNTLVDDFLKDVKSGDKILDLGCGSGRNFVKTAGIIYGVDFSGEMLKHAGEKAKRDGIKVELTEAKATKLPFEDNYFDYGISVAVFHCMSFGFQRRKALREFHRVLKPKGKAFITVWNKEARRFKNKSKNMKVSWRVDGERIWRTYYLYEEDEFVRELESVGFKIIKKIETRANLIFVVGK